MAITKPEEKYGWWNGSIYITNGSITQDQFNEFFDHSPYSTSLDIVNTILSRSDEPENTEVIAIKWLNESVQQDIKSQIMDGYVSGEAGYGELGWELNIHCTLDGEDIDFVDLSDETREHIVDACIDECIQGEICETVYTEYTWEFDPPNYVVIGNLWTAEGAVFPIRGENADRIQFFADWDAATDAVRIRTVDIDAPDEPLPDIIQDNVVELKDAIRWHMHHNAR